MRVRGSERVSNVEMDLYVGREEHNSSPLTVYPMSTISVQTTSNERGNACSGILSNQCGTTAGMSVSGVSRILCR